jgi:hypothetical protein
MYSDYKTDVKANMITAITDWELKDRRHGWVKMGFLSRFILFSYSYPSLGLDVNEIKRD